MKELVEEYKKLILRMVAIDKEINDSIAKRWPNLSGSITSSIIFIYSDNYVVNITKDGYELVLGDCSSGLPSMDKLKELQEEGLILEKVGEILVGELQ